MGTNQLARLLAAAEREFEGNRAAPAPRKKFKAMKLDVRKFDNTWERRRTRAARLMAVLLRDDDQALLGRVSVDQATAVSYEEAVTCFKREAVILRRTAVLFEVAAGRVASVLSRYRVAQGATP